MEKEKEKVNYSLEAEASEEPLGSFRPEIRATVRLEVNPRDVRCIKGHCNRDCADCG